MFEKYRELLNKISDLLPAEDQELFNNLLTDLHSFVEAPSHIDFDPIHLSPHELLDLPPELIKQLALNESDNYELELIRLIDSVGGTISLDKLIVLLYRDKGEIADRVQLNARLNRMMRKETIFSVPKKKGVYRTTRIKGEQDDNEGIK